MGLALFDLDNTLLAGDSDYLWGRFLGEAGLVDAEAYERENLRYYEAYRNGTLDIFAFLGFALRPLAEHDRGRLEALRARFVEERIRPIVLEAGRRLVERHRARGDHPVIITATNRFVTEPIAALLGVDDLLATEPEERDGRFTGRVAGVPCFREGKVERLRRWLEGRGLDLAGSWFYTDSHNDLPLLGRVAHPVAVDPDPVLRAEARRRGWPVITLRAGAEPRPDPLAASA
ncbi:HAD family hydrolase [Inmirania thermothiophila]|uniref:Histidinol-phosphatase n=1 Tax=Inmirania thermothiophila TaxID=1750597 RepID=A0A3N1Y8A6_9GAMM|nr:HAD family hydrolase [Inmirania thermothiophila]ROR35000.1 HAD superfamily hydrolase (TIGR01490 family) [Inmirania thermothiophila]